MADDGAIPRLHPADLALIVEAISRGVAPGTPDVDAPPTVATGADAALFRKIMREEIERNKKAIAGPDLETMRSIVREEIRQDHEAQSNELRDMVNEAINKLRTEFFDIFEDVDMNLEKGEHRKATRDKLAGLFAMHAGSKEFRSELWKSLRNAAIGWMTAAIMGAIAFIGLRGNGGPPH